jgi:hypothetical protein
MIQNCSGGKKEDFGDLFPALVEFIFKQMNQYILLNRYRKLKELNHLIK